MRSSLVLAVALQILASFVVLPALDVYEVFPFFRWNLFSPPALRAEDFDVRIRQLDEQIFAEGISYGKIKTDEHSLWELNNKIIAHGDLDQFLLDKLKAIKLRFEVIKRECDALDYFKTGRCGPWEVQFARAIGL